MDEKPDLLFTMRQAGVVLPQVTQRPFFVLCPFHKDQRKPNLRVDPAQGVFHCFACGVGGDAISFVGLQMSAGADYVNTWNTGMLQAMLQYAFLFVVFSNSEREFDYQQKVLAQILEETEGQSSPVSDAPEMQEQTSTAVVKVDGVVRSCFRTSGGFNTSFGAMDTVDLAMNLIRAGTELKEKYIQKGVIMDDGGDNSATCVYDQGHLAYTEMLIMYDHHDDESAEGAFEYLEESNQACLDRSLGAPIFQVSQVGEGKHGAFGPASFNYDKWLRKIKSAFDPNGTADPTAYSPPEE